MELILFALGVALAVSGLFDGAMPGEINGTHGDDDIVGTGRGETINGLSGDDYLQGRGGDDLLDGGSGYSRVFGGGGDDSLAGVGLLSGEEGDDVIDARADPGDRIEGRMQIYGGEGRDQIFGSEFDELIAPGQGGDTVFGGGGDDEIDNTRIGITADAEQDALFGGGGEDTVRGRLGIDSFFGGQGDDRLAAFLHDEDASLDYDQGTGSVASIDGGAGRDILVLWNRGEPLDLRIVWETSNSGTILLADRVTEFSNIEFIQLPTGNHVVDGSASDGIYVSPVLVENSFDDSYVSENSTITGGSGDDTILTNGIGIGGMGADSLYGGQDGWSDRDGFTLEGGAGSDVIRARYPNVPVSSVGTPLAYGGDGADDVAGGNGALLYGGAGNDTLNGYGAEMTGGDGLDEFTARLVSADIPGYYFVDRLGEQQPELMRITDFEPSSETLTIETLQNSESHNAVVTQSFDARLGGLVIAVDGIPSLVLEGVSAPVDITVESRMIDSYFR